MANSKELAEQAFSLLSDALRNSEERVAELDAELKRKRSPKNRLEEQTSVLSHRLEATETERDQWRQEAGHLDELLANERAKSAQLKKKLEVAESGPDKVSKKEVNFWRQRADEFDQEILKYKERIASLREELRQKTAEADNAAEAHLQADIDLSGTLDSTQKELTTLKETLQERDSRIAEVAAELEKTRAALASQEQLVETLAGAKAEQEASGADFKQRNDELTRQHEQFKQQYDQLTQQYEQLMEQDDELRRQNDELRRDNDDAISNLHQQLADKNAELEQLRSSLAERSNGHKALEDEIDQLRESNQSLEARLEQSIGQANATHSEQANLIETLNNLVAQRDTKIAELEQALSATAEAKAEAEGKLTSLEEALAEERECTVDLSQLANERREEIEKLVEKLEETDERYQEAKWRLGRAAYFEKLVSKRKTLIKNLIGEVRAKVKANTALKAGIDGLRTYKANSERNQQKLLARADRLSDELAEARETIVSQQRDSADRSELEQAQARATELEERVKTQVELIDSLEDELKTTKLNLNSTAAGQSPSDEIEALRARVEEQDAEISRKDNAIVALEADIDDLQKRLGKLRGSESETMRLRAVQEQDHNTMVEMEREIEELRAKLDGGGQPDESSVRNVREKDEKIRRLKQRLQEQDVEIDRLSEAVSGWQRKYEFLAAEAPAAYQANSKE